MNHVEENGIIRPLTRDEAYIRIYGRPIVGDATKRRPRGSDRERILAKQNHCCLYCDLPFGSEVSRLGKRVTLRLNWDHFIPHAYAARNSADNWVAACHVCNGIKSSRMFGTIMEAQYFLRARRRARGYQIPTLAMKECASRVRPGRSLDVAVRIYNAVRRHMFKQHRPIAKTHLMAAVGGETVENVAAYHKLLSRGFIRENRVEGETLCIGCREYPVRPKKVRRHDPSA